MIKIDLKDKKNILIISLLAFIGVIVLVLALGLVPFDSFHGKAAGTVAVGAGIAAGDLARRKLAETQEIVAVEVAAARVSEAQLRKFKGTFDAEVKQAEAIIDGMTLEEKVALANMTPEAAAEWLKTRTASSTVLS